MANILNKDKQIAIVGALAEGSSIRSIERITGVHRDTIMRLGVRVGQGCTALMDSRMRNLGCARLEMDEIWGFVGKKDRNLREGEEGKGSVWTFCAIDADTKLVPAFKVGQRDLATAKTFVDDVASRMRTRVQISTDGLRAYVDAIEQSFGGDVDYAQIVKTYGSVETTDNRRYSAPQFVSSEKTVIQGSPKYDLISTSYVERLNATTRLHMRRLTRLTLAFSKKLENFEAAVGLHFAYYNFVKRHNTLRCTPAMAAGVTGTFWTVRQSFGGGRMTFENRLLVGFEEIKAVVFECNVCKSRVSIPRERFDEPPLICPKQHAWNVQGLTVETQPIFNALAFLLSSLAGHSFQQQSGFRVFLEFEEPK